MAKFCGKCGSMLNENGLCPKCDAAKISAATQKANPAATGPASKESAPIKKPIQQKQAPANYPVQQGRAPTNDAAPKGSNAPTQPMKLTRDQKKTAKKAEKKRRKNEKRAAMSFGQKAKRFFLKLLAIILALAILAGSVSCALVYFGLADIPFVEKVMGLFGYEKEELEANNNFASVSGKFTNIKITDAKSAIEAAREASAQLGLTNATDELSLQNKSTVDGTTYYRLQQNYNGIPVYGKTIVVVADKNGDAKSITSNLVDTSSIDTSIDLSQLDINETIKQFLEQDGFNKIDSLNVKEISKDDLLIYTNDVGDAVLACNVSVNFTYEYGKTQAKLLYDLTNDLVILRTRDIVTETATCYGPTKDNGSFEGLKSNSNYYMKDVKKNIYILDAQDNTFYDPNTGALSQDIPQYVVSSDEYFGNNEEDEATFNRGFDLLRALTIAYDYYANVFNDPGIGTIVGVFDDHVGSYNGDNAGGGIVPINSIRSTDLIDFSDPNQGNSYAGHTGLITYGTSYSENVFEHLDTLFHEYTHFITRKNVDWVDNSVPDNQSGAINEGYSDIFGEIIESYYFNSEPNWEHGSRIMHNPSSNGYADKVTSTKNGTEDYTHGHSTVVSYAAYLMHKNSNGDVLLNMKELASLWYKTSLILPSDCTFYTLRTCMEQTAEMLGFSEEQKGYIANAFDTVEIHSNSNDGETVDLNSEIRVNDKNGQPYDNYIIHIDGDEFTGLKTGLRKKEYHNDISVNSSNEYNLSLPKGDYSITIEDSFSGLRTNDRRIKARKDQKNKRLDFTTTFGFDYNVSSPVSLEVRDVNNDIYDAFTVKISGTDSQNTKVSKTIYGKQNEAIDLDLTNGNYSIRITDNDDSSKSKSFSVKVMDNALTNSILIRTSFGKPYGEFDPSDLPDGAKEYNGHYYYVYDMPSITSWDAAQEFCRSKNGYLATLTTPEENTFVYQLVKDFGYQNAYFGLIDSGYDEWQWINHEAFSYTNWANGEPSSYSENYGMYYNNPAGKWNDGDFGNYTSEDRTFICEWGSYGIDNGQIPETPTLRKTSDARDIVMVLDVSGSMAGDKISRTRQASERFINRILEQDASIGVVTYDDSAEMKSDFSTSAASLIGITNSITDGGGTNIEDGLAKAATMLTTYSNAQKQIIVLMSDGAPNEGKTGEDLINYAQSLKESGISIFTLGFYEGSSHQSEQELMERIATDGKHYEVNTPDDLEFLFTDIADLINGQAFTYARIACPVDVKVTYNGETLDSTDPTKTRTSFGSLTFEENREETSSDSSDDRIKVLRLKADQDYDIEISGNGRGRMNYTIGYMDENGEYSDMRRFTNIKINKRTKIDTNSKYAKNTVLKVDEDGDGKYDLKYKAGENERAKLVDYSYVIYIVIAVLGLVLVLTLYLIIKRRIKKKKEN